MPHQELPQSHAAPPFPVPHTPGAALLGSGHQLRGRKRSWPRLAGQSRKGGKGPQKIVWGPGRQMPPNAAAHSQIRKLSWVEGSGC